VLGLERPGLLQVVREVASKTNDDAGDGPTTATILAQAIVREGTKAVAAGMNPMDLRRGVEAAVDAVVREQGGVAPEERRGTLVVVDEMQSMPGVDYESMLSELGKFGASFILATQSLAKLNDLSLTMRDTILANVGCLAVFQVSGSDARQLVWELGKDRVSEDDITSLPVHHCYVRATVGTERMPAFSMLVRKPKPGDADIAARIRAAAAGYTTSATEIAAGELASQARVEMFRKELTAITAGEAPAQTPAAPKAPRRRTRRVRTRRQPKAEGAADPGRDDS